MMSENLALEEEKRPWGDFKRFTKNCLSTVKIITIKPLESLSLQSHARRAEFWHIIEGSGVIEIDELKRAVKAGDEAEIPVGSKHRISAAEAGMKVLEIAFGDFDEGDILRYEDAYGRI